MRCRLIGMAAACAAFVALPSLAGGSFFENWDSYATGQDMHGVGGWKGWDNDPTWTAFTSSDQALSAPNSIDINGNADLVHEHDQASGVWSYSAWQYIPGNFNGQSYFILLNTYNDGGAKNWSSQITFDSSTNMVAETDGGETSNTPVPILFDQWVEIEYIIDLDNDTFIATYNGSHVSSGPWSQGGALEIGAVDLFANGATSIYYDNISITPAPGVIALLGIAGLAGRRRRRMA